MQTLGNLNGGNGYSPAPPTPAPNGNGTSKIIRFETNIAQTLAVKNIQGQEKENSYGKPEVMYFTTDGRILYVPPIVREQLMEQEIQQGEMFTLCKREMKGDQGKKVTRWIAERADVLPGQQPNGTFVAPAPPPQQPPAPRLVQPQLQPQPQAATAPRTTAECGDAFAEFLILAGRSIQHAQKILATENNTVQFDSRDVAAIATSMFIAASNVGVITWRGQKVGKGW